MVTAYFDIETKYLFDEVGGYENMTKLGLSVACLILDDSDDPAFYEEKDIEDLFDALSQADLIVGHNIIGFDYPVLDAYASFNVPGRYKKKTFDTLHELYKVTGRRIGLQDLGHRNLGRGKTGEAVMMPHLWRDGQHDLVKEYCANDVRLVRDIFLHGKNTGHITYTDKRRGVLLGIREVPVKW
jgi:DEAD/DEAH box helicase domain-containing protein